ADLLVRQHLVEARFLDVQNLAFDRQNRLEPAIAALLGRAACGLTLDDIQLAPRRIPLLAVRELARQREVVERAFAPDQIARFARGLARERRFDDLGDDSLRDARRLFQERAQP